MTPEGEPGVSDFGISTGDAARRPQDVGASAADVRFELAAAVRRITSVMVGLPLADSDIAAAAAGSAGPRREAPGLLPHQPGDRLRQSGGPARRG
jgi:hypothetical protein